MKTVKSIPSKLAKNSTAFLEAQWVDAESIRHVIANLVGTKMLLFFAMTFMTAMLYGHAPISLLMAWFAANCTITFYRLWLLRDYSTKTKPNHDSKLVAVYKNYAYTVIVNAYIWGVFVFLFIGVSSSYIVACCLIVLLLFALLSLATVSSHLNLMKQFLWAYGGGLASGILLYATLNQDLVSNSLVFWYLLMVVTFMGVLFLVGIRMNSTYVEGLRLQFRNQELIAVLTEQRETALAAVATKNRMLASATHDMRQPVLALDLYAGWLVDDPAISADIAPKIAASTKAVISLFDSLFDMSRLSEGQVSTNLEEVNLNELLASLYMQYQPIAKSKKISLRIRPIAGTVFTDYILLERILGNLLSNALKYTGKGGALLACRRSGSRIKIEVWDTGLGISAEQQKLVFKEFYKNPTNKGTNDGFGLGLAIVAQLSDLIGAKLSMRSRPGRGTVVTIQLEQII